MKSKGLQKNEVSGQFPESGAIFMASCTTFGECLERKIFALSQSYADFVRDVKPGMILFLFEYEKRELYGVFKATSNGEMDIIPHAFTSSGRQFPAQVVLFVSKINYLQFPSLFLHQDGCPSLFFYFCE